MSEISESQQQLIEWLLHQDQVIPTKAIHERKPIPMLKSEALRWFYYILPDHEKLLEAAVEILDRGLSQEIGGHSHSSPVQEYYLSSNSRCFWKVAGSSRNREYLCLKNYCSCKSFCHIARGPSNRIICKHLLAVKIARVIGLAERKLCEKEEDYFQVLERGVVLSLTLN